MDILGKIDNYLNEGLDIDKAMKSLFDGKEKKKMLLKSSGFIDKMITLFISSNEFGHGLSLNADALKKILTANGFTSDEVSVIRRIVIEASKVVTRFLAKKHKMEMAEIPDNFGVYTLINLDFYADIENEFNELLQKEVKRRFGKLK